MTLHAARKPVKYLANMCKTGFRTFHGAHSGFQQSSKYIGFMCVSDVRAHPSARRARTCPHLASSWQLLSHKGAQMTSAEPQNDTRRRPNGQKTRPRRPRLTTFVPELAPTDLPPTSNQPTNQHIKDQGFALFPVGWPVTSPQASSIRPPHRCRVEMVVLQGLRLKA